MAAPATWPTHLHDTLPFWHRSPRVDCWEAAKTVVMLLTVAPVRVAVCAVLTVVLAVAVVVCRCCRLICRTTQRHSAGFMVFFKLWVRVFLFAIGFWWIDVEGRREVRIGLPSWDSTLV